MSRKAGSSFVIDTNAGSIKYVTNASIIMQAECPAERWWELAASYPAQAMCSPLFDLLTLESPERWAAMEAKFAAHWRSQVLYEGTLASIERLFLAQCLERAMSIFRKTHRSPKYEEVTRCLRRWGKGRMSKAAYLQKTKGIRPRGMYAVECEFMRAIKCPWRLTSHQTLYAIDELVSSGEEESEARYLEEWRRLSQLIRDAYAKEIAQATKPKKVNSR